MLGQKTKRQLEKALEALRESNGLAKRFSSCLDESQNLLARARVLLDQAQADAATWRRRYDKAQNKPDAVSVCDEIKAVNGWVN